MPIKNALLLAAGKGTRLRPLTDTIPKCLVEIDGTPLLEIWIQQLAAVGIENIYINTHYLSEKVEKFIANHRWPCHVECFFESELKGTLGTLASRQDLFEKDEGLLVAHADNLCLCNWGDFFTRYHKRAEHILATMMTFQTDQPSLCGIVELNAANELINFHEKVENPPSQLANAAVFIFDSRVKSLLQIDKQISEISLDLIPKLFGKVICWENTEYMRDIGNIESLQQANHDMRSLSKLNPKKREEANV